MSPGHGFILHNIICIYWQIIRFNRHYYFVSSPLPHIIFCQKESNITYKSKYKLVSCKYVKKCPLDMLILKERKNKIEKKNKKNNGAKYMFLPTVC